MAGSRVSNDGFFRAFASEGRGNSSIISSKKSEREVERGGSVEVENVDCDVDAGAEETEGDLELAIELVEVDPRVGTSEDGGTFPDKTSGSALDGDE